MVKKNVIITSSNQKYGDFLINHWLRSLKENVNLEEVDAVVLDYGLTDSQVSRLKKQGVILFEGGKEGHVNTLRFIDIGRFLKNHPYDQVLAIDGGDIIFQSDISFLFDQDKHFFRAAIMEFEVMFFESFSLGNFNLGDLNAIRKVLKNKKTLNAGVIFGPARKFIELSTECQKLITNKWAYGPDQIVVNYFLYKEGVKLLDKKFNFLLCTVKEGFDIRRGIFFSQSGQKIAIVHNGGREGLLRPIINFGYGKQTKKINYLAYLGQRLIFKVIEFFKNI